MGNEYNEQGDFDWKYVVMLLVAIAGVGISVWLWQVDLSSRSLTVRLVSSIPLLQQEKSGVLLDLELRLDGVKIDAPYLSTVEISNDGSKPIASSDFESPLALGVGADTQIIRAKVGTSTRRDLPAIVAAHKNAVKLQPLSAIKN